ncbi:hypothetical protein SB6419_02837 [Klebsiella spallanzanii]|nr:hypothetical protein SB6419_02837 [Klebsiella spallanzanii]
MHINPVSWKLAFFQANQGVSFCSEHLNLIKITIYKHSPLILLLPLLYIDKRNG